MNEIDKFARQEDVITAVQDLTRGRSNATGTVTLTVSVATTTVTNKLCNTSSVPVLVPTTAVAATEVGNGTIYISTISAGSFVITHANSATAGRTFSYSLHGG